MPVRTIGELAERAHQRWERYRRIHPGRSVPINDTISRLFEHAPDYLPRREHRSNRKHRPVLMNPGVFTMQKIADALGTTVGDLLGEAGYEAPRDLLTPEQRRSLKAVTLMLRDLFDLDDPTI
jgi:hypothetical protein